MNALELRRLAKKFAMDFWGKELDVYVGFGKLKAGRYGQYSYRYVRNKQRKVVGYTPVEITISSEQGFELPENRKQLESVLKHELCHWYCQQSGKAFKDGSKDFEAELLRRGAMSTHLDLFEDENFKVSAQRQQEVVEGKRSRLGSSAFDYVEVEMVDSSDIIQCERKYAVYYNGVHIGYIRKWKWSKYRWNPISDFKDWDTLSYTARKHAGEALLKVARENGLV